MKNYLSLLKKSPLFNSLNEGGILRVIRCLDGYQKDYEKNQIIYNYLDQIDYAGIVLEGEVSVVMLNFCGNEHGVRKFVKGDLFGNAYACLPLMNSAIQILASDESKILFLKLSNLFLPKAIHCPYASQITINLLKETVENNLTQDAKIEILIQRYIRDKLILYLSKLKINNDNSITLAFNRQELADHLGVERSALSRELGKMKKEGLIDFHKNKLYILKEYDTWSKADFCQKRKCKFQFT